jgi:hypothetical protein
LHGSASVSDNAVFGRGGGILATRVALHDQATVSGNTSTYPGIIDPRSEGGGIFAERVKVDDDASVMDNASEQNAGGILGRFVRLRDDATVGGNTTLEYGGGVMVRHLWDTSARSKLEMDGAARITGNSAGIGGGGAFLEPTAKLYVCSDAVVLSPNSPDDPPVALACT